MALLGRKLSNWSGVGHADRPAAQPLDHLDAIDTIDAKLRRVDVLERELDLEVHVEAAPGLTDQAEIGVVNEHMDVRQPELRTDGQFLDQELEVIVTGNGDHVGAGGRRRTRRVRPAASSRAGRPGRN